MQVRISKIVVFGRFFVDGVNPHAVCLYFLLDQEIIRGGGVAFIVSKSNHYNKF